MPVKDPHFMRFDNVFNWGNIISLVVICVGGLWTLSELKSELQYTQQVVEDMQTDQEATEVRLRALELGFGRIEERLVSIQGSIQQLVTQKNEE